MSPDDILGQLARMQSRIPREALAAADAQRAELTQHLLASLAETVAHPEILENDRDLQLPFYAMYFLAAWREKLAHPLLLGFLRLPGEQALDLSGDIVTEDLDRMLAQTCGGDPGGMVALALDPGVNEWARGAAVSALSLLTVWGELPRETLVTHYREIVASCGAPVDRGETGIVLAGVVSGALDLQLHEMRDELLVLIDRGWVDTGMVGSRKEVVHEFDHPHPVLLKSPIVDIADAIRWWGCFERTSRRAPRPLRPDRAMPAAPASDAGGRTPVRVPPKIGRNEPCPCGNGKKYKKCCGT
ncbi:MAG: DUF1186 domain-containing protein [Opitutaceae bacterium]